MHLDFFFLPKTGDKLVFVTKLSCLLGPVWQFLALHSAKSLRILAGQISVAGSQTAFPLKISCASFSDVPRMCISEVVGFPFVLV